jgi:hypothetical protein
VKYRDALNHGFNTQKYVELHLPETCNKINELEESCRERVQSLINKFFEEKKHNE